MKPVATHQSDRLGTENMGRLLYSLSLPSMMGMMAITLYHLADTIFVGRGVGTMALAGVSVSLPFLLTVTNIGLAIGIGGASIISRALGARDHAKAQMVLNNIFKLVLVVNVISIGLAYIFIDPLLYLFGANHEIIPYARSYSSICLVGSFFMNIINVNMNAIRAEGNARFVMFVQTGAALLNVVIDPIFIFWFKWGVQGAALATVLSQAWGASMSFWYYYNSKKRVIGFTGLSFLQPFDSKIIKETLALGASSFARHIGNTLMSIALFQVLLHYSGSIAIAAFGIIFRLLMFTYMPIFGINQGFMPIAGYNYGARNFSRVLKSLQLANIAATSLSLISFVAMLVWSRELMSVFTADQDLVELGHRALQIVVLAFPLLGIQIIGSGLYQALGKSLGALFLALARQVVFLIPFVLLLPLLWGETGIWIAFPASDFLAGIITLVMIVAQSKLLRKQMKSMQV